MTDLGIVSVLEEKIERLLSYLNDLEKEKSQLIQKLKERDATITDLSTKIETLEGERADVGSRVERMLEKIESITTRSDEEAFVHPSESQASSDASIDFNQQG